MTKFQHATTLKDDTGMGEESGVSTVVMRKELGHWWLERKNENIHLYEVWAQLQVRGSLLLRSRHLQSVHRQGSGGSMSKDHALELLELLGGSAYASELRMLAESLDSSDQFGKRNGSMHRALGRLRKWGDVEAIVGEHGCFLYRIVHEQT